MQPIIRLADRVEATWFKKITGDLSDIADILLVKSNAKNLVILKNALRHKTWEYNFL